MRSREKLEIIRASAVVCTYNRAESLRDTLRSLGAQKIPDGLDFDVLVIDNNSKDHTAVVVDEMTAQFRFKLRRVLETRQGIGWARNRGLEEGGGDYIFFIDDDAVAEPDWVVRMVRCMEETGADFSGGKITELWMTERPRWMTDDLCGPVVKQDYGLERRPVKSHEGFLTANVCFRRASIGKYGMFDPHLGRKGDRWIGGEDFELFSRWLGQGAKVYYEPFAVVQHKVEAKRISPEFYRGWYVDIGYTQGHQMSWKNHYRWTIMPFWRWKLLFLALLNYTVTRFTPGFDRRFRAEIWWRFQISFFQERFDHWKSELRFSKKKCAFAKVAG